MRLSLNAATRIALFACLYLFFLVVTSVVVQLLVSRHPDSTAVMRIGAVVQDVFMFIVPAVVTALLLTRLPAQFLSIARKPSVPATECGLLALVCSIPAMNRIISMNASMHLPESMAAIEAWMRQSEAAAQHSIDLIIGPHTIPSLMMTVRIMGTFAALGEELFYRGALQRLLLSTRINAHAAVWITAFIFSAMHMQFFGFVPRLLLGAFLGYAVLWSGSLWVSVILHAANNIMYLVGQYMAQAAPAVAAGADNAGNLLVNTLSAGCAALFIYLMYRLRRQ